LHASDQKLRRLIACLQAHDPATERGARSTTSVTGGSSRASITPARSGSSASSSACTRPAMFALDRELANRWRADRDWRRGVVGAGVAVDVLLRTIGGGRGEAGVGVVRRDGRNV
jgi:hypothetical protein